MGKREVRSQKSEVRMKHSSKTLSLLALSFSVSLCLCGQLLAQTPATTTVQDTVYRSDGSVASGTVLIKWPAFVTGDGRAVFGGTKTVPLTNGALAVALAPNSGASPSGTSYNVRYFQSGGVFFEETWVVPASSPLGSPAAPNVATVGTPGSTTYYYWVTATNASGETLLSPSGVITTSNGTLDTNNYNQITWSAVSGATGYRVYRSNNANAPSGAGNHLVGETTGLTLNDQSNTLSTATVPALNTTDPRDLADVRVTAAPSPSVTLAAAQVQGNAIVSNPSATQTILAPSGSGIPLQIKGRSNNTSNVFEVYDNQSTPVLRSWFDAAGAFKTSQAPTFSSVTSGSLLFGGTGGLLSQDNPNLFWNNTTKRFQVGPRTGFNASYGQAWIDDSLFTFGRIKSSAGAGAAASFVQEDYTTGNAWAVTALTDDRHTTGTRASITGLDGYAVSNAPSPALTTNVMGVAATVGHEGTGTTVNLTGMRIFSNYKTAGTVTNNYGIRVDDQAGVGINNWAIKTGTGQVQFGDALSAKSISQVRYADQFPGADACAKIAAAIADLPAIGGTVDARGLEGAQSCAANPFASVLAGNSGGLLLLGSVTLATDACIQVPVKWRIVGMGRGEAAADGDKNTTIRATAGFSCAYTNGDSAAREAVFILGERAISSTSGHTRLENLVVDANGNSNIGIYTETLQEQGGLTRVEVRNPLTHGILIEKTAGGTPQNYMIDDIVVGLHLSVIPASAVCLQITGGGSSHRGVDGFTCNGDGANGGGNIDVGTKLDNGGGVYSRMHYEYTTVGILLGTSGGDTSAVVLSGIDGHSTVTDVVKIDSASTLRVIIEGLNKMTATNAINDDVSSPNQLITRGTVENYLGGGSQGWVTGTLSFGTLESTAADPAESGAIRLGNAQLLGWETATPGADLTFGADTSNRFAFANGADSTLEAKFSSGSSAAQLMALGLYDRSSLLWQIQKNSSNQFVLWDQTNSIARFLADDATNGANTYRTDGTGAHVFAAESTELARITSAGRLGLNNVSSPATTLDVNGAIRSTLATVGFSATPTFDASLGNSLKMTLTGNVTSSTLSNAQAGQQISWILCQDGTGSRTFVWPANVKGGMTISAGANTCSAQNFLYDGTNAYALSPGMTGM